MNSFSKIWKANEASKTFKYRIGIRNREIMCMLAENVMSEVVAR